MNDLIEISRSIPVEKDKMGGKSAAIARLAKAGFNVPHSVVVTRDVYDLFIDITGLRGRILLELTRKDFSDMRWEEMWDTALRIRNYFLTTPWPASLKRRLETFVSDSFKDSRLTVRSSAPEEDSSKSSFAGIHESIVNRSGAHGILDAIKLVWASLWSDRAMMYRRELGLDIAKSSMAVLIQEFIEGEKSGIFFGVSPYNKSHSVIEAVYGLNQGLVDGSVQPDRWMVNRETGIIESHIDHERSIKIAPTGSSGVITVELSEQEALAPPLTSLEVEAVFRVGKQAEKLFGTPQDVEWTFRENELFVLQSRPITTNAVDPGDERSWYRTLKRSLSNLRNLRKKVEQELVPEMIKVAEDLVAVDLDHLTDSELAQEIIRRDEILKHWTDVYWKEFIPFAHAVRLFGEFYNDYVKPEDPFEFVSLLVAEDLLSIQRNRFLLDASEKISGIGLNKGEEQELASESSKLDGMIRDYAEKFKEFSSVGLELGDLEEKLKGLFLQFSTNPVLSKSLDSASNSARKEFFLGLFTGPDLEQAEELLELARFSYRMRDDDNIYLGRLESRLKLSARIGANRLKSRGVDMHGTASPLDIANSLKGNHVKFAISRTEKPLRTEQFRSAVRQLRGQPASAGLGAGTARVINVPEDLFSFQSGEVLVCDAIDPNITFIIPLCAGIVERRGGMLIHGAIIAREYGIACVTGVPEASSVIRTGDHVTVDGFLGIVTLSNPNKTQ